MLIRSCGMTDPWKRGFFRIGAAVGDRVRPSEFGGGLRGAGGVRFSGMYLSNDVLVDYDVERVKCSEPGGRVCGGVV
ncbi:hypothetical protein CesoFtcFv8_021395 [Champsocephalus esox]|uniref:Uncharacterized protein n=1 Tax=Champsocephalus esox TaxID=159716 RepID=A0AAN8BDP1_9TELE|nr:hypothetical protein CesoFtcFv8_021395 [Champsocephalus esox]